ncbi:phosphotransferase [Dethiothermospora halolimnae]|uniref:phosphotransferase n=1 Tax=Dethiothermospora halolimnae TaxID=3114390 RepID=UPI003CCB7581
MSDSLITSFIEDIQSHYNIKCSFQREITGGWKNKKWKAHSSFGDIVIKELSDERYNISQIKRVEKALMIQSKIYENIKIVPRIFKANKSIIQEKNKHKYMIMEYIDGEHRNTFSVNNHELFLLGKALAYIHSIDTRNIYSNSIIIDDHFGNLHRYSKSIDSSNVKHNTRFYEISNRVEKIIKMIPQDFFYKLKTGFTHSDFTKDNILFTDSNVKILDFDRGRIGYQLQDVGRGIMTFTYDGTSINKYKVKDFIKGYNTIIPITKGEVYKSLRLIWVIEVTWWIQERFFDEDIEEKLRDFREEIIWLTNNWESLEDIIDL